MWFPCLTQQNPVILKIPHDPPPSTQTQEKKENECSCSVLFVVIMIFFKVLFVFAIKDTFLLLKEKSSKVKDTVCLYIEKVLFIEQKAKKKKKLLGRSENICIFGVGFFEKKNNHSCYYSREMITK